jgi:hypothetical protein
MGVCGLTLYRGTGNIVSVMRMLLLAMVLAAGCEQKAAPADPVAAWQPIDPTFEGCAGG